MRGRRPTPTYLRVLRGNPGKRSLNENEPQPEIAPDVPEPPTFLAGFASDEWWRVAPALHRLGLLSVVDVAPLAAYCVAYARWRTAEETLAAMAQRDETTGGLLVKRADGNAGANPLVVIARKAAADMVRVAGEFGLTPVARARIAAGPFEPPGGGQSKFGALLGG